MAASSPDSTRRLHIQDLHDRAHAAVRAQQTGDGWWSEPLETAVVAVADAQHQRGARRLAEPALASLTQWLESGEPRPLGDDAAAAALTARAARALHGGGDRITAQAVELVSRACKGSELALAPLHVALAAWGLTDAVADRRQQPWDDLRTAPARFSQTGVNGALVTFAVALADQARPPMPASLADATAHDRLEECLLLWLLNAAVDEDLVHGVDQDRLRPLLARRTELLDRLSAELRLARMTPLDFDDFNPFDESEEEDAEALGLFEAAMLDLALSGLRPEEPLITLSEAQTLHAGDAAARRRIRAAVGVAASVALAGLSVPICVLASAPWRLTVGVCLAVLAGGSALSVLVFLHREDTRWSSATLIVGLLLEVVLAAFLIVEGAFHKVFVGDEVALVLSLVLLGVPFLLQALVDAVQKQ